MITLNFVFEDDLSEMVMLKIIDRFKDKFYIGNTYNGNGFGYIKKNIKGFNQASKTIPFFVLTDLDQYECPSELINNWLNSIPKNKNLIFRVAIREIEAWLLADRVGFSKYLGVSIVHLPLSPESEMDAKRKLISIAARSRNRSIKEDITPKNENAQVGPNYNGRLGEYVFNHWNIDEAMLNCESLKRAVRCLEAFQQTAIK
jgi:hypothetical protein